MCSMRIKSVLKEYEVNFYNNLPTLLKSISGGNILYLIDENVDTIYREYFDDKPKVVIPASEYSKTIEYSSNIFNYLIANNYKIDTHLIVVGGGILQDIGGFIASTFCRGIEYTLVPTTLLAQCDSCIGGKTSINHAGAKNIIGTFYPPSEIKICTSFLDTLSESDIKSGYGELFKFYLLNNEIHRLDLTDIGTAVEYGLRMKSAIIEKDEFDLGERKLLNFGHTFAHALESTSNYAIPHGSAVIIGILIANEVSREIGTVTEKYVTNIRSLLLPHLSHLKIDSKWFVFSNLYSYIKLDKKNTGKNVNMILHKGDSTYSVTSIEDFNVLERGLTRVYEDIRLCN